LRDAAGDASGKVLLVRDGRAEERSVRLGLRTLDAAEVLEGLAEGDVVLLGGTAKPGARVRTRLIAWKPGAPNAAGTREDIGSMLGNSMGR
jgi:HlyD family secretion protein